MIKPTVGRVVWFWPSGCADGVVHDFRQPFKADVAYVWHQRLINVFYVDHSGSPFKLTSVAMLQDDDRKPEGQPFCTWMPYQVGQAEKHEVEKSELGSRPKGDE